MELWIVNGGYFKLPFYVEFENDVAQLSDAIDMLGCWYEAVNHFLAPHGVRRNGLWNVPRHEWLNIAEQAESDVKPEDCVVWNPGKARQPKTVPVEMPLSMSKDADEFVRAFVQDTGLVNLTTMQLIWHALGVKIMERMVNKEKPVDLGFAVLHPLPYRSNWKSILTRRFPWFGKGMSNLGAAKRWKYFWNSGLGDELMNTDLLAYNEKEALCYWTIDVEYRKAWYKNILKHEREKLRIKGRAGYAKSFQESVKRCLPRAAMLFFKWTAQISRTSVKLSDGKRFGSVWFMPHIPENNVRPQPPEAGNIDVVVGNKTELSERSSASSESNT